MRAVRGPFHHTIHNRIRIDDGRQLSLERTDIDYPKADARLTILVERHIIGNIEIAAQEASRNDPGQRVSVWFVPESGHMGDLSPPDRWRNLFAAIWSTVMALIGWLGVIGYVQREWRKRTNHPPQTEPSAVSG